MMIDQIKKAKAKGGPKITTRAEGKAISGLGKKDMDADDERTWGCELGRKGSEKEEGTCVLLPRVERNFPPVDAGLAV